jgi:hypothetical protein
VIARGGLEVDISLQKSADIVNSTCGQAHNDGRLAVASAARWSAGDKYAKRSYLRRLAAMLMGPRMSVVTRDGT